MSAAPAIAQLENACASFHDAAEHTLLTRGALAPNLAILSEDHDVLLTYSSGAGRAPDDETITRIARQRKATGLILLARVRPVTAVLDSRGTPCDILVHAPLTEDPDTISEIWTLGVHRDAPDAVHRATRVRETPTGFELLWREHTIQSAAGTPETRRFARLLAAAHNRPNPFEAR